MKLKISPPQWAKALASAGAGTLLFLSCASFDIWPLCWLGMIPLFFVILDEKTERPAVYGFICGMFANGGGFYWIVGFLQRFGHLPLVAAIPIFLLLIGYQAITFAIFASLVRRLRDGLDLPVTWLAPMCWVGVELVVPYVFPWYLSITQAWVPPVIQIAELTGPLGVSFLLVLSNGALYEIIVAVRKKERVLRPAIVTAVALLVGNVVYGYVRIAQVQRSRADAPKVDVGIVQANIGIHEKWRPGLAADQLAMHQKLSIELAGRGAQLMVWPESSYPYLFLRDQAADWPESDVRRAQRGFSTPLLFGTLTRARGDKYPYNSALMLDGGGNVRGRFDKNILMVFGEYVPFYEQAKWVQKLIPEVSNWARGTDVEVFPFEHRGQTYNLGPMICYEDIFPSFGRRLAKKEPNLLVNITNDAWFGNTSEPYEHMALSVYRAIELRVDLIRAVNTGVSTLIDSTGRVVEKTRSVDPDEEPNAGPMTLLSQAALQKPQTVYAHVGDWIGGLCLLLVLLGLERSRARGGNAIVWPLVGWSVAGMVAGFSATSLLFSGASRFVLSWQLLFRAAPPEIDPQVAFDTGIRVAPGMVLGVILAAWLLRRASRTRAGAYFTELGIGIVGFLILPATIFGRLEGEQAGLILGALFAVVLGLFSLRLFRRRLG